MKKFIINTLITAALTLPPLSYAAENKTDYRPRISGYYKNLATVSKTLSTKEDLVSYLARLRFELKQSLTKELTATVTYDNEIILNNFSDTPDFDLIREKDQRRLAFWDMDEVFFDEENFYWKHSLYRAYVQYYTPQLQCTVGKQGIDWSRMRFYHLFDLFNPVSPLDIEGEEKVGVDAVNVEFYPKSFMMFNAIYAPGLSREKQGLGFRFSTKFHDYDLFLIGAEVKKDEVLGFGFDGYIKKAGFRGETTYTFPDESTPFFRASLGLDYSFTRKLYSVIEYFYNGNAKDENIARFLGSYQFSRRALSMKKHIIGAGVEYELTGIKKLNNYLFYDFEGNSLYYNPEFKWNIKPNFDLTFGCQIFEGDDASEYGSYYNLVYAEMKYFF